MTTTPKLLGLFRIDQQILGLQSGLKKAERFLEHQTQALGQLETKREALDAQRRQAKASEANIESEIATVQGRIDGTRARMNAAKTNKEYQAVLQEVSTLSAEKGRLEEQAIGLLEKIRTLEESIAALDEQIAEGRKVCEIARKERDQRADEIRGRIEALKAERSSLVSTVPSDALSAYEARRVRFEESDEVMAVLEAQNIRRFEFTCGSCMIGTPMNTVTALASGRLTLCPSCGVILYLEESVLEKLSALKK